MNLLDFSILCAILKDDKTKAYVILPVNVLDFSLYIHSHSDFVLLASQIMPVHCR